MKIKKFISNLARSGALGIIPYRYAKQAERERSAKLAAEQQRQAADRAAASEREIAVQSARQQELMAARDAAVRQAADLTQTNTQETPEVNLDTPQERAGMSRARKRRQSFGVGSSGSGVNI